ncbi:hypothetical protein AVEN_115397-1 [Araneus ventricosus]|uniref:Uncharacterized protein n=1 Tax=Araneus ventricosus TaxID=182803 RepID=A0A4Y1ZYC2_ARAVE|nr:hypothetical protein AVEN_115397-1 [Araneus ventricosus]
MVIEQSLMKSSKMQGSFMHGRSTKENVLTKFVVGLLSASNISEGLENFCGLSFASEEKHVDSWESRVKLDQEDVKKLSKCFCAHNLFSYVQMIMSIATGFTSNMETINC